MILVTVSTGHFDPLISECSRLSDRYNFYGQIGCSKVVPKFPYIKTLSQTSLNEKMREAELVISHAGTGMLTMLYKLQKKAIVIPKQIRYGESNDGQIELARKWSELGLAILCMNVEDLSNAIERCKKIVPQFCQQPSLGAYLSTQVLHS